MRKTRLDPEEASPGIYVIVRVYNLTNGNIGMRILVDPATMERNGVLVIEAENYTVLQQDAPHKDTEQVGGSSCVRVAANTRHTCSRLRRELGTCLRRRVLSDSRSATLVSG